MEQMDNHTGDRLESAFFQVLTNKNLLSEITKHQGGLKWDQIQSGDWCAKNGHLSLLKEKQDLEFTTYAIDWAATDGRLDIVKWLHENRAEGCTTNAMDCATGYGNLEMVKWLHENRTEGCTKDAMMMAAKYGHLEMVEWLYENRTECCSKDDAKLAAKYKHLDLIECANIYWRECRSIGDTISTRVAKSIRKYECLEPIEYADYVREFGTGSMEGVTELEIANDLQSFPNVKIIAIDIMKKAMENGYIKIAIWLYREQFVSYDDIFEYAMYTARVDLMEMIRENMAEFDPESALITAAEWDRGNIIMWLRNSFKEIDEDEDLIRKAWDAAYECNNHNALNELH
jgi:hypothetical protein